MEKYKSKFKNELKKETTNATNNTKNSPQRRGERRATPTTPFLYLFFTQNPTPLKDLFYCLKIKNIGGCEWQSVTISENQWLINLGRRGDSNPKNLRLSASYYFYFLHFYLSFCFLIFDISIILRQDK